MLVLSREKNERIFITCPDGTRIEIVCVEPRRDKCRIGIDAPKDYAIHREEVQEVIDRESLSSDCNNIKPASVSYDDGGLICGEDGT